MARSHADEPILNKTQVAEPDMADDHFNRAQRGTEFQRQPAARPGNAQSANGGDPLAELARLIGKSDPFANIARGAEQPAPPAASPAADPRYAAHHHAQWAGTPADPRLPQPPAEPRGGFRAQDEFPDYGSPAQNAGFDHFGRAPGAPRDDGGYDREPHQSGYHDRYGGRDAAYGGAGEGRYGSGGYDSATPPPDDIDEFYEDEEPRRRRGGMLTVMAVVALAVLGTAGAFAYRVLFNGPSVPATPPVIKANTAPTKVVPAAPAADASSGKLIYDRVGERSQTERLVPREEPPLDVKAAPPPPRVVLSNPAAAPVAPARQAAPAAPPASAAPAFAPAAPAGSIQPPVATPAASTEPKKVRTLVIRPDQPAAAPAVAPAPAAPQPRAAEPEPVVQSAPPAPVRTAAPRPQAAPGDANAPLSLIPQTGAAPRGTMRTAAAGPARPAVLSSPAGEGVYSVQVTSRRSEPEAQASFRALQAQFPNLLGSRQAVIRRADLGEKGVYYRALVGSFASADEASQLCRDLKAAGGECVVQRN